MFSKSAKSTNVKVQIFLLPISGLSHSLKVIGLMLMCVTIIKSYYVINPVFHAGEEGMSK